MTLTKTQMNRLTSMHSRGMTSAEISEKLGIPATVVAGYKAALTRRANEETNLNYTDVNIPVRYSDGLPPHIKSAITTLINWNSTASS